MRRRAHTYTLRLPVAIATAVALVVVLGLVRPGPVSSRTAKEAFWTQKAFGTGRYNILFAGDSRLYRGIAPAVVQQELAPLPLTAFNLGLSAGGHNPTMFTCINDRLVTQGERAVVLGLTPFSLTPQGQENGHWKDLRSTTMSDRLINLQVAPRIMFVDPIQFPEIQYWIKGDSIGYYESFMPDGWVASRRLPLRPDEALKAYGGKFKDNLVSQGVLDTLMMQVKVWRQEGIKVFAFRPPSTPEMVALEDSLSGYHQEAIRQQWEAAGGIWLDVGPDSDYISYDGSHLDKASAVLLSQRMGKAMRKHLSQ